MASKNKDLVVKMESTAVHESGPKKGQRTGYYVTTKRNAKNRQMNGHGKLELMKYDPRVRKRVLFVENKKLK